MVACLVQLINPNPGTHTPCALLRSAGRRNGFSRTKLLSAQRPRLLPLTQHQPSPPRPLYQRQKPAACFPIPHDLRKSNSPLTVPSNRFCFPSTLGAFDSSPRRLSSRIQPPPLRLATSTTPSTAPGTRFRAGWYMKTEYCAELNRQGHAGGICLGSHRWKRVGTWGEKRIASSFSLHCCRP